MSFYHTLESNETMSVVLQKFRDIINSDLESIKCKRSQYYATDYYELKYKCYILNLTKIEKDKYNDIDATLKLVNSSEYTILTLGKCDDVRAYNNCKDSINWIFDRLDTEIGINNSKEAISKLLLTPVVNAKDKE